MLRIGGGHNNLCTDPGGLQKLNAIYFGHIHIQENQVCIIFTQQRHCLQWVFCLSGQFQKVYVFYKLLQHLPGYWFIVNNQAFQFHVSSTVKLVV